MNCTCDEGARELLAVDADTWAEQANLLCPIHGDRPGHMAVVTAHLPDGMKGLRKHILNYLPDGSEVTVLKIPPEDGPSYDEVSDED